MLALARIGVLVERGAVEAREAVLVLRKVAGHPVENHADAGLVTGVDERLEILGRAEAAGRREEADHLIAPRAGERMLHHRQQLDVREAQLASRRARASPPSRDRSGTRPSGPRRQLPRCTS